MSTQQPANFGEVLKRYRLAAGLSQEELARRAGLSPHGISDLERGARRTPRLSTVRLLAEALGLGEAERAAFLAAAQGNQGAEYTTVAPRQAPAVCPNNLPIQPTPLVGREREVAAVYILLRRDEVRLLTLTGPGGVGKTRLGLRVAAEVANAAPESGGCGDGVWFVRLSRLTDPDLVVPTIAQTLGLREVGDRPITEVLREYLRPRQVLLLLDNFEHLLGAAPGVAAVLEHCPGLRVLVTSRERLHLSGEFEYPVLPLALPDPRQRSEPEHVSQFAAVRLFIQRAAAVQPSFYMTEANARSVADICARLDGLPLAIELAAAKVRVLPPPALLARLERQLPVLVGGARDLDERQQTMRNTLVWSYDLLTEQEQRLFRRLAVFVGGATLDEVEAVCVALESAKTLGLDALEGLSRLVDQSLVQQRDEGGEARFVMLHVIREYALEQLLASGEEMEVRRRHCEHYIARVEAAESEFRGPRQLALLVQGDREHDNVRAALRWAQDQGETGFGLRLAGVFWEYWVPRGLHSEGRRYLETLLALDKTDTRHPASLPVRVKALRGASIMARHQGDLARAEAFGEEGLALCRQLGDEREMSVALTGLGLVALKRGDLARARVLLEESLAIWHQQGDARRVALELGYLANVALLQHDYGRAVALSEEALELHRLHGSRTDIAQALASLGHVVHYQGDQQRAAALLRESLILLRDTRYTLIAAPSLEVLASIFCSLGEAERAARLLGAAAALQQMIGTSRSAEIEADYDRTVAAVREAAGAETFKAQWAAGTTLGLEEAIAEALGEAEGEGQAAPVDAARGAT